MTAKMGFSGEFVKSLSPADRKIYIMYYEEELEKAKNEKQQKPSPMSIGSPMEM